VRFGLKAKFAINLLIILLVAMFLLDFVIMMVTRQALISAEADKARIALATLEALAFTDDKHLQGARKLTGVSPQIKSVLQESQIICGRLEDKQQRVYQWGRDCPEGTDLVRYAERATEQQKPVLEFLGSVWGGFYERSQYMVVAGPVSAGSRPAGSICLVFDLGPAYASLDKTQKLIIYYILINALLLTFFGVYRLWQITGKPLQKLVRRADEFQPDEDLLFVSDDAESEFNRLSRSLNRMLENIDADKKKLKSTVLSLEQANAELKQAHKEVLRAEKMASVGRLSSGIAHEIGNPIGIVLGYLDLLRQENLSADERLDYIERAQSEIGRVNDIIRELLDFARPAKDESKDVPVHAIVEEIVGMLRQQPMMKAITLSADLAAGQDVIQADPQRLRQVFLNLLINPADAIKLEPAEQAGHIRVASRNTAGRDGDGQQLQIVVEDNGPGIPDDQLNSIFDPFYTTKEPGKGTGLGLSVCFMITAETGGTLRAEAAADKGTRFVLSFPCAERKASP